MAKNTAESSLAFSTSFLKKYGYLNKDYSHMSGTASWSHEYSESKSKIGFYIERSDWGTPQEKVYMNLHYGYTDGWNGEKEDMNFRIDLTTTPCHYGGARYWFVCPLTKSGTYCGNRVGVLYAIGKWFGCRKCGNIAYSSQMRGGRYRGSSVCLPDIDKLEGEIKTYYYAGKPTRKHKRLTKMKDKFYNDISMIERLL
jgi:hypothetical protein